MGDDQVHLSAFRAQIEQWTEVQLRPYLDALGDRRDKSFQEVKEFNDAVWRTVVLQPLEVVILDGPLLQRLRHIRQLGVVHLVYPSATHTRLDHSLGTLHQVAQLVRGINAKEDLISKGLTSLVRVAALCHDVGHGVMSHVSENALRNFRETTRLMREFHRSINLEQRKPSEAAAYYMIGSKAFGELIAEAQRITGDHKLPANPAAQIQNAIVGKQISPDVPLLHELISGPFDADKLDYMTRDAQMTGVPVVTDIPRLVQKVRGRRMATADLPREVKRTVPEGQDTCVVTGVALSGGRSLDELVFGQTLLTDKLYRHQKVRAAEAMVSAIFDQIADIVDGGPLAMAYALFDADLMTLDRQAIERLAGRPLEAHEETRVEVAVDISRRLCQRRLFRRAYAFAPNMPLDPYKADSTHGPGLMRMSAQARRTAGRHELVEEIVEMVREILSLRDDEAVLDAMPGDDIAPYIWIDPPKAKTQGNETVRAFLLGDGFPGPPLMAFRDDFAETPGWSNAYLLTRDTGYVFTIEELALPVYIAMEKIARLRYGVRSPKSMLPYAKQDTKELDAVKRELAATDFYKGVPFDIRPTPEGFAMADFRDRLSSVKSALGSYEGPVFEPQERKRSTVMSNERIEAFVQQFDSEHGEAALIVLEQLHVVGRPQLIEAVKAFLEQSELDVQHVVPLGEAKDSSAVTTYNAGDIGSLTIRSLGDALGRDGDIMFAEDFVGTGTQTISLLENLLGEEPSTDLNEEREPPLRPELRELLRRRNLAIVFAAGCRDGADEVEAAARRLDLKLQVYLHREVAPTAIGADQRFLDRCREVGRQLLADDDPEHDEEWVEKRLLGYGNRAFLVVFPYNTPTQTLTCLWKGGIVDGVEWVPLVPRRPKR